MLGATSEWINSQGMGSTCVSGIDSANQPFSGNGCVDYKSVQETPGNEADGSPWTSNTTFYTSGTATGVNVRLGPIRLFFGFLDFFWGGGTS